MKIKFVLLSLILLSVFVCGSQAQSKTVSSPALETHCFKQHSTAFDFYDSLRFRPVTISSIEGPTVYYQFQDRNLLKLESAVLTDKSDVPPDLRTKFDHRRFLIVFCQQHFTVQIIQSIPKNASAK
jgi:hypothetical protein